MKLAALAGLAAALIASAAQLDIAQAQISGDTVKIGILNDMSGLSVVRVFGTTGWVN